MAFNVAAETSSHVPANSSATRSGRAWVKENGGGKGGEEEVGGAVGRRPYAHRFRARDTAASSPFQPLPAPQVPPRHGYPCRDEGPRSTAYRFWRGQYTIFCFLLKTVLNFLFPAHHLVIRNSK